MRVGGAWGRDVSDRVPVIAYLVLAHERPEQVAALAARIVELSDRARVLIHWDGQASHVDWPSLLPNRASIARARVSVKWGRWSMVEAELALFAEARATWTPDWFVLLSGVDWPARDLATWETDLLASPSDAVMNASPILDRWAAHPPAVPIDEDELRRTRDAWWIFGPSGRPGLDRLVRGVVRRVGGLTSRSDRGPAIMNFYGRGYAVTPWRRRSLPPRWTVHRGDQWLALRRSAVDALARVDPRVTKHFARTLIPDESYIQTIVASTPGLRVDARATSVAPWHAFAREPHLQLTAEDVEVVLTSRPAFVRKIGPGSAAGVMRVLDEIVDSSRAQDSGAALPRDIGGRDSDPRI